MPLRSIPALDELVRIAGTEATPRPSSPMPGLPIEEAQIPEAAPGISCSVVFHQIVEDNRTSAFMAGRFLEGWAVTTCFDRTFSVHVYGDAVESGRPFQPKKSYSDVQFEFTFPAGEPSQVDPLRLAGSYRKQLKDDGTWYWKKDSDAQLKVQGPSPRFSWFKIELAAVSPVPNLLK